MVVLVVVALSLVLEDVVADTVLVVGKTVAVVDDIVVEVDETVVETAVVEVIVAVLDEDLPIETEIIITYQSRVYMNNLVK